MSQMGHERRFKCKSRTSALPPIPDIVAASHRCLASYRSDPRRNTADRGERRAGVAAGEQPVPPLVKTGNWMTHLEFDFETPIWRHLYRELSRDHQLIRYDTRGNGLSDREVEDVSLETYVGDLEAVVEAAGLERFALFGISQGCAISIAYAVRHPERITHLVLLGGFALGVAKHTLSKDEKEQHAALLSLIRLGWGEENPAFRQMFTSRFIPGGTKEQMDWFNELQRISTSPDDAVRNCIAVANFDVSSLLAQVSVPTLVMHARDDALVPFDQGRRLAGGIPGAKFVPLAGRNHLNFKTSPPFPVSWRK
jgi:pimeloyl-ACP methyl ester carboxylesterase